MRELLILTVVIGLIGSCNLYNSNTMKTYKSNDAHSYAIQEEAYVKHLDISLEVNFDLKSIKGEVIYDIVADTFAQKILFDTRDLNIHGAFILDKDHWQKVAFNMGLEDNTFGQSLSIPINSQTQKVKISYTTKQDAAALQWLTKEQTAGGDYPFLFTQSQAILARTWLPCQDSPGIRMTYTAKVKVPDYLMAVMSATNVRKKSKDGVYHFKMEQPIPSYLMALAVGDLVFDTIGPRTAVYAEAELIDKAVYEFGNMEKMLESAEALYGPYKWDRYDVIVLPPSFPFGGMENPRMTFLTPTIISGDRSLTSLIAHELAHSWSGNLVTNATWDDFWLNEGFTVYFERRIMESIKGKEYAEMLALLGYQDLEKTLEAMGDKNRDTHLKLNLDGRDPDDGLTDIAYEKGYFFIRALEDYHGRKKWDSFLRQYFEENAFKTMNTEEFCSYLKTNLSMSDEDWTKVRCEEWIYGPGIPDKNIRPDSDRFTQVDNLMLHWFENGDLGNLIKSSQHWSTHEWLHFLRHLPKDISSEQLISLDMAFGLTKCSNSEKAFAWYIQTIEFGYEAAEPAIEAFLISVGRRKFLTPLYASLIQHGKKEFALKIYKQARPMYHAVSKETMDELLGLTDFS